MKSLEEHNAERMAQVHPFDKPVHNGIACPKCGAELFDSNPCVVLASYPAQKAIHCTCGYHEYRIA